MILLRYLTVFCMVVMFMLGCGTDDGDSTRTSRSMKPEGFLSGTARPDSVPTDDFSAGELESLTETGLNPFAEGAETEEYRRTYGRSTAPLLPIFFDFDSSSIKDNQLEKLNENSRYLLKNMDIVFVIEGNCDERGTTDYNLALGELRALNVKKYLANSGVTDARMSTISYGSQRPLFPGSDEESWAMNRRVDLVIR